MRLFPARTVLVGLAAAALAVAVRGQTAAAPRLIVLENVGLPAVDVGVTTDTSHAPGTAEAEKRRGLNTSAGAIKVNRSGLRYAAGKVIVRFRNSASAASRLSALRTASSTASISLRPDYADFDVVTIDPSEDAEAAAKAFRTRPDVEYAQADYRVYAQFVPNDPLYSRYQWNLPMINLEPAWDIQPQAGSMITIAVVDTGVAYQNATIVATAYAFRDDRGVVYPALGRLTLPYSAAAQLGPPVRFVAPHDFVWNTTTPLDFDGHGTHVSGTIGQLTNDGIGTAGVAFNVKIMPVKVLASDWDVIFGGSTEVGGSDDDVARGIRYAADNGAQIINLSLGGPGPSNCGTNPNQDGCAPVIESAMRYAVGKGCFIAVAAGNSFVDGNPTQVISEIASRVNGAVSVAAIGVQKARAPYSSTGSYVELAAPGGSGGSADSGYIWQQTLDYRAVDTFLLSPSQYAAPRFDIMAYVGYAGTSQATPHVSGVAAMLMQQGVTNPAAIEAVLERFAVDLGGAGRDTSYGYGLVDARNVLRGLGLAK